MSTWDRILHRIGATPTRALMERFGGRRLYIPARIPADHPLREILAPQACDLLCREWGSSILHVPRLGSLGQREERKQAILDALAAGAPIASVAARFGVSERWVYQIAHEAQRSLFSQEDAP
ncbi:MAG: Mor transcription activator family protein [Acidobacteriota bacterium]